MEKSERIQKLGDLETALKTFIARERERLVMERKFLEAVKDKSTGRIDAEFVAASKYAAKEDAKALVGLR